MADSVFPDDLKKLRLAEGDSKLKEVTDDSGRRWFVKNMDEREAAMTLRAAAAELGPDAITHVAKVKPIEWKDLSDELKQKVHDGWNTQMMLIEAVPNDPGFYQLSNEVPAAEKDAAFAKGLDSKPVTREEQEKLVAEWEKLNAMGVHHRDLGSNVGFKRHKGGKLVMGVFDFDDDPDNDRNDVQNVKEFIKELQEAGTAEKNWAAKDLKKPTADEGRAEKQQRKWETPN